MDIVFYEIEKIIDEFKLSYEETYMKYISSLKDEYFINPGGIHGILHTKRVLILNIILSSLMKLDTEDRDILLTASIYHDIGRSGDGVCYFHGLKSWNKIKKYKLIDIKEDDKTKILKFIIQNHCIDDKNAIDTINTYKILDIEKGVFLFGIFKDADALDRVRLGDLDYSYLRNDISRKLGKIAQYIFDLGEDIDSIVK